MIKLISHMEILEKLFGSLAKVKLIKLFVFNPETQLTREELMTRAKLSQSETRRTLGLLKKMGLIKEKKIWKEGNNGKKRVSGFFLDQEFVYLKQLQQFLLESSSVTDPEIVSHLARAGKLKLVVMAGVFLQDWNSRVDLLVVGDNLKQNTVEKAIRTIEADMGRELTYAMFDTDDFKYRLGMYDKLVRDILDFKHRVLVDKIGLREA